MSTPTPQTICKEIDMTGTTILALEFDQGVIIAGDTFTTRGSYIADRAADKLEYITDNIYCMRSGVAAQTQALARMVRHYLNMQTIAEDKMPRVRTAAQIFREIIYNNKNSIQASIIIAGWDDSEGGQVYSISSSGSIVQSNFHASGSGSAYNAGYSVANFKENMSFEEARKFAINTVAVAMNVDNASGGCVRFASITKDGFKREFISKADVPFAYV